MADYRWIYDLRKDWWFCPVVSLTEDELTEQVGQLGGFMPTVGLSAILFFKKYSKPVNIIGFDCFESGMHNLNEAWDKSGNHATEKERIILGLLAQREDIVWNV